MRRGFRRIERRNPQALSHLGSQSAGGSAEGNRFLALACLCLFAFLGGGRGVGRVGGGGGVGESQCISSSSGPAFAEFRVG